MEAISLPPAIHRGKRSTGDGCTGCPGSASLWLNPKLADHFRVYEAKCGERGRRRNREREGGERREKKEEEIVKW